MTRVLVIDDEEVIRSLMREILERAGYETIGAETAEQALSLLEEQDVSLVVSDIVMPGLTGLELLEEVRARRPSLPVILVTGAGTYENLSEAVTRGANGLVIKPFSHADLQNAVAGALERIRRTEHDVRERLLAPTLAATLANAIEARDAELHGHCERLGELAARIAERVGLSPQQIDRVRLGAVLHDVGKIAIPDRVLLKNGRFTDEERELMRLHPEIGERLLEPIDFLADVRSVVRHHHERWDGGGYPDALAGEDIPLPARIVTLADSIEAMSAPRAYRAPLGKRELVRELGEGRGVQWDPELVDVALDLIESGELSFSSEGLRLVDRSPLTRAQAQLSVLLVEDDDEQALLAAESLESASENVRVVHARDAATAKELCRSSRWALAIVDYTLPDGDGLELLQAIKERTPTLPVVLLTGEGSEAVAIEAFRRGAADYVVKGNGHLGELRERVRPFLEAA
jgi:putative two-component system response regulator